MKNILITKLLWPLFLAIIFLRCFNTAGQNCEQEMKKILIDQKLIGMSAVAVCGDSIIYSGNFGLSDYARNISVTDSTVFRVASISKTATATALMILYEKGLFSLDDDIGNVMGFKIRNPNFPDVPITYRMLLSHTSSLQDGTGYSSFLSDTYYKNYPPKLISLLSDTGVYFTKDLFQKQAPGTYFIYCNLNFGIIATLVEKMSGERFDKFCRKNIFEPLGIKAGYRLQDLSDINNVAVLYRMSEGEWQPQADNYIGVMPSPRDLSSYIPGDNGIIFGPQGSLRISAKDLAKFMMMHMNGGIYKGVRILRNSTIALMHSPQWTYNGANGDNYYGLFRQWGLGFHITTNTAYCDVIDGFDMKGHYGESYGLLSDMFFNEENKFGMIFLTNGCETPFGNGSSSAFYSVEENVFFALNNTIQQYMSSNACFDNQYGIPVGNLPCMNEKIIPVRYYLPIQGYIQTDIYNTKGQCIRMQKTEFDSYGRKQILIDTEGLQPGIYFCNLHSEGSSWSIKILIPEEEE